MIKASTLCSGRFKVKQIAEPPLVEAHDQKGILMQPYGLTVYHPDRACSGYTLFTPMTGTMAYLIDMQGAIVHRWTLPGQPGTYGYLLDNGHLLSNIRTGNEPAAFGGRGGRLVELDWESNAVWDYVEDTLYHDFDRLPNGNTMVLGWEQVPSDRASQIQGGLPGTEHEQGIWGDYFREITPDHQTVWEWHGYDHLDVATDWIGPLHRRAEWTHANACDVMPDGNVLTSFRMINTVGIIDKTSGNFTWKWGQDELGGQHDPNPLPNGNILTFDNGWYTRRLAASPGSRVIEVDAATDTIVRTSAGATSISSFAPTAIARISQASGENHFPRIPMPGSATCTRALSAAHRNDGPGLLPRVCNPLPD